MRTSTKTVASLADTNILVYCFDHRYPAKLEVAREWMEGGLVPSYEVIKIGMSDFDALGNSRSSRGVDDVGKASGI